MKAFFLILLLFPVIIIMPLQAQEIILHESIKDSVFRQLEIYPQEKIHLHTDRDMYVPGEKIWFKAYVADANTHLFPTYSRYVYVELINTLDSLVDRVMVRQENEMFYGHLFISEMIPAGKYTVRAYTRYMENMGEEYFFKKTIRIGNFQDDKESDKKKNPRSKTKDDYDVSFFPEGGNLLEGAFCRIAFKALNEAGYSEAIIGDVVDENGIIISEVKTTYSGMGSFVINAAQGKQYYLECRNGTGLKKRFKLPEAKANAYSINTIWNYSEGKLIVSRNKSGDSPDIPHYLLIHCRGALFYFSKWDNRKDYILFDINEIPSGVVQILLFDMEMNPLSERLVFNKTEDKSDVIFSTDKNVYGKRDLVSTTIQLTDFESIYPGGNISVAITDDNDIFVDSLTTIESSLLLSSELKGYIETPAYYLQDNKYSSYALDHLMMTHGWRRYNIPEVIKGNMAGPIKPMEKSKEISGVVKRSFGKPADNAEVIVMTSRGDIGQSVTNEKGEFLFSGFDFPDSTTFFIQTLNKKGNPYVELTVKEENFPKLKKIPYPSDEIVLNIESIDYDYDFMKKAEDRSKYDEDMRFVQLQEVTVTAKRPVRKEEARDRHWMNSGSDVTIGSDVIERRRMIFTVDLLSTIPGVRIIGGIPYLAGSMNSSFGGPIPALIIIDGMIGGDLGMAEYAYNIESIDLFKGGSASIFGSRGTGGAISITTKTGTLGYDEDFEKPNIAVFSPIGYQAPAEFYSPKYDTPEAKNLSIPDYRTTIFWKPDVVINDKEEAHFDFYTSDFPSTYSVVIEGMTNDGRIIRQIEKIEVK